jgi:D-alanyl-lipoteichoic acid acyltransferase DltB (MBOAT superfamily)
VLFNSYLFIFGFLPLSIFLYALADPHPKLRMPALIGLSFAFYSYWNPIYLALLLPSILVNWLVSLLYQETKRAFILTGAIAANLLVLGLFKYENFFAQALASVTGLPVPRFDILLPLGISFFTFHHIMYLVDLRRGIAPVFSLDRYALYICFFPQVLSGPLVRWSEVMDQFGRRVFAPGWERRCAQGLTLVVLGLIQKTCLGDQLADVANALYERAISQPVGAIEALVGLLAFSFQIFFDFSGYTDVAIGVALIFGIVLPRNFDAPYRACSIRDFWRRWHMTLSRFLRDYLYVPLGGNRHGPNREIAAIMITMGLGGLWHGAGWGFVIWGLLHGAALIVERLWRRYLPPMPGLIGWALTFTFVTCAWAFFRADSFATAWRVLEAIALMLPGRTSASAKLRHRRASHGGAARRLCCRRCAACWRGGDPARAR